MVITNNFNISLDEIDREILILLQTDAKITINEIAEKIKDRLGLDEPKSATAIRARVKKLEKDLIKKYMAIIDCSKLGYREMVIASLRVNSKQPIDDIKKKIESLNEVKYAYIVTGEYPLIVMFKCLNHEDAMILIEKLRNMPGVEEIKTQIVLDRIKEDHSIIIPEIDTSPHLSDKDIKVLDPEEENTKEYMAQYQKEFDNKPCVEGRFTEDFLKWCKGE